MTKELTHSHTRACFCEKQEEAGEEAEKKEEAREWVGGGVCIKGWRGRGK